MQLNFMVNDYLLIWSLLFGPSISEEEHAEKQKLWLSYKRAYHALQEEQDTILKDVKNYIPDDDTIYNLVFSSDFYPRIKRESEKHRIFLMEIWDKNKKFIQRNLKEILRLDLPSEVDVFVVHPQLDLAYCKSGEKMSVVCGKKIDSNCAVATLSDIIYLVVRRMLSGYQKEQKEIVQAVLELAIQNELLTRVLGKSTYMRGDNSLKFLKRQIYPYFLMYLGADKEELPKYMMRDAIAFDMDQYVMEKNLAKIDLLGFIEFCIKNQRYILRINQLEII